MTSMLLKRFKVSNGEAGPMIRPMRQYPVFCQLNMRWPRQVRGMAALSEQTTTAKAAGDISSVFPSLSGTSSAPLPSRFADLKARLIHGHEDGVRESWVRLLSELRHETETIRAIGSGVIPEISFVDVDDVGKRATFKDQLHKRGVAIIRGVVPEKEALDWKEMVKSYVRNYPSTKGFPPTKPTVYELYWTPSQILSRGHPNVLKTQAFLMSQWHSADESALISTANPTTYADRLRIRQPGDAGFALGPHIDSGSCERWEENGYGCGNVYKDIFNGAWEKYDPWESSCRLPVVSDLYNGAGACSMFRMFQGLLSMSETGPGEGTLKVNPLLGKATAYFLLRPFFTPKRSSAESSGSAFLDSDNWKMEDEPTPTLQGAVPSNCQELNDVLHPHLRLENTMVHIPRIRPGDYVAWHCDTIHAVDRTHAGSTDSSVMYIPACPLTEANARYLARQREALSEGIPAPDFPSGPREHHQLDHVISTISVPAQRALGLYPFEPPPPPSHPHGEDHMLEKANAILGFQAA